MKTEENHLTSLANTLVVLGIVFGSTTDRLIGYSFIGIGVLLSIISWSKSKKEIKPHMMMLKKHYAPKRYAKRQRRNLKIKTEPEND